MPAPTVNTDTPPTNNTVPTHVAAARSYQPRSSVGHSIRMRRILNPNDNRTVILPLDHAMVLGVVPGIVDPRITVELGIAANVDAVLFQPGIARYTVDIYAGRAASLLKITNGASVDTEQWVIGSVDQALVYDADAICVEFYLGDPNEMRVLHDISRLQREAERYGLPVIMHAYVHPDYDAKVGVKAWIHACRIAGELGADIVKTAYITDKDALIALVEGTPAPVVVAGGDSQATTHQLLSDISGALRCGVSGVAVGRRAWGAKDPQATIEAIRAVVHETATVDDVMSRFGLS